MGVVRIGVLGAARITPNALIAPASALPGAEVVGIAARDPERARAFAAEHGIARTYDSYHALLADPDVDAVYNPLPNSLHGRWTIAAVEAGKHVMCEKPFTANAAEAEQVGAVVRRAGEGLVVMEAMHYRYHPLAVRMIELVQSGVLGAIRRVSSRMIAVVPRRGDIRYDYELGGGATMDVGCYAIHQVRSITGEEPTVTGARAKVAGRDVDRWMQAEVAFAGGATGRITCALLAAAAPLADVRVQGERGSMTVLFPNRPQMLGRIVVRARPGRMTWEHVPPGNASFWYQLRAFCAAVTDGTGTLTPVDDSVATMRVIDAVYDAAGLPRRVPGA